MNHVCETSCGARAVLATQSLPSAVRNFAAIDAKPRRTAECVEEREQAAYHPRVAFPQTRLRRLRRTPVLRDVVRETRLDAGDFVLPMFIEAGLDGRAPISAMPGVDRLSISQAVAEAGEAAALGLPGVLLYGIPTVVVGENMTFMGDEELLRSRGVSVQVLQDERCMELMRAFIAQSPELWNEDIGT